jgi:hypothetical protein
MEILLVVEGREKAKTLHPNNECEGEVMRVWW